MSTQAKHAGCEEDALPYPLEEVLEAAWVAEETGREETVERAAHFQKAVSDERIDDLQRRGLLEAGEAGAMRLTALGRSKAEPIIRRHRLAERLLCDVLHSDLDRAEESACVFEHLVAPDIADAICTLLGHPETCPHGRPIPAGECCRRHATEVSSVIVRLPSLKVGQRARIAALETPASPRMQKLLGLGLAPGRMVELLQRFPVIVVRVEATQVALDAGVAQSISVYAPSN